MYDFILVSQRGRESEGEGEELWGLTPGREREREGAGLVVGEGECDKHMPG